MSTLRSYADALRGPYKTRREFPVRNGQIFSLYQVMALETSTQKLVRYDSAASDGANVPYCVIMSAGTADGDTYLDYVYNADSLNGTKLVFKNTDDTWQDVAESFRAKGIIVEAWNPAENIPLTFESESEA